MQSPVELHSRPKVSTFQSSVFIKDDQFGTRLKGQQKAVSTLNKGKSALAEHVCDTKHVTVWKIAILLPLTIAMVKDAA